MMKDLCQIVSAFLVFNALTFFILIPSVSAVGVIDCSQPGFRALCDISSVRTSVFMSAKNLPGVTSKLGNNVAKDSDLKKEIGCARLTITDQSHMQVSHDHYDSVTIVFRVRSGLSDGVLLERSGASIRMSGTRLWVSGHEAESYTLEEDKWHSLALVETTSTGQHDLYANSRKVLSWRVALDRLTTTYTFGAVRVSSTCPPRLIKMGSLSQAVIAARSMAIPQDSPYLTVFTSGMKNPLLISTNIVQYASDLTGPIINTERFTTQQDSDISSIYDQFSQYTEYKPLSTGLITSNPTVYRAGKYFCPQDSSVFSFSVQGTETDEFVLSCAVSSVSFRGVFLMGGIRSDSVFIWGKDSVSILGMMNATVVSDKIDVRSANAPFKSLLAKSSLQLPASIILLPPDSPCTAVVEEYGWDGRIDDVMIFKSALLLDDIWRHYAGLPLHDHADLVHHTSFDSDVVNSTFSSTMGQKLWVKNVAFETRSDSPDLVDYGWQINCTSELHEADACESSCLRSNGELTCTGGDIFCPIAGRVSQLHSDFSMSAGSHPLPSTLRSCSSMGDCRCDVISVDIETHYDSEGSIANAVVSESFQYSMERHHDHSPKSLLDFYSDRKDPYILCMYECDTKACDHCKTSPTGRKLMSDETAVHQFELKASTNLGFTIQQNLAVRSCKGCNEETLYPLAIYKKDEIVQTAAVSGKSTPITFTSEVLGMNGPFQVVLSEPGVSKKLIDEPVEHYAVIIVQPDSCVFCTDYLAKMAHNNASVRHSIGLLLSLMIGILMVALIILAYLFGRCCIKERENGSYWSRVSGKMSKVRANTQVLLNKIYVGKGYEKVPDDDPDEVHVEMAPRAPTPELKEKKISKLTPKQQESRNTIRRIIGLQILLTIICFCDAASINIRSELCKDPKCPITVTISGGFDEFATPLTVDLIDKTNWRAVGSFTFGIQSDIIKQTYDSMYHSCTYDGKGISKHVCGGTSPCKHVGVNVGYNDNPGNIFTRADSSSMSYPGKSSAHGSCKCLGCSNCWSCSTSCIYDRAFLNMQHTRPTEILRRSESRQTTSSCIGVITPKTGPKRTLFDKQVIVGQTVSFTDDAASGTFKLLSKGEGSDTSEQPPVMLAKRWSLYCATEPPTASCTKSICQIDPAFVSDVGTPVMGKVGQAQCPAIGSAFSTAPYAEGIINVIRGRTGTDDFQFLESNDDQLLDKHCQPLTGRWKVDQAGGDGVVLTRQTTGPSCPYIYEMTFTTYYYVNEAEEIVCPELRLISEDVQGDAFVADGCALKTQMRSSCSAGKGILVIHGTDFEPSQHVFPLGTEFADQSVKGFCRTTTPSYFDIELNDKQKGTGLIVVKTNSVLPAANHQTNSSTNFGKITTGIGGDDDSTDLDYSKSDQQDSWFRKFFGSLGGGYSNWRVFLGFLLFLVYTFLSTVLLMCLVWLSIRVYKKLRARPKMKE